MKTKAALLAILLAAAGLGACHGEEEAPFVLATAQELLEYPAPLSAAETPLAERLFMVILQETNLVVILRPITEGEFGSFQVQAISAQVIDLQMLAAAIVLPAVAPEDIVGFSTDLVAFLHRMVNEISGFAVFTDVLLP